MLRSRGPSLFVAATSVLIVLSGPVPVAGQQEDLVGSLHRFDLDRFKRIVTIDSPGVGDAFGTRVSDRFLVTAPGAAGGGLLAFVDEAGIVSSATGSELADRELSRLGEDWADLGHPPGTQNALAVGAPGEPAAAARFAAKPAVAIIEYRTGGTLTFSREVRRITGPAGSLFGWRVESTDSQFPAASYNASIVVAAPLEDRGRKLAAGAVYKFDVDTGKQLWKFRGDREGELAGYSLDTARDRNGDGVPDVWVGAPGSRAGDPAGRVYLLSGANGKVLAEFEPPEGALLFGYVVLDGGSLLGLPGFLATAPATPKGKKGGVGAVYNLGDDGEEIAVFTGRRRNQWFGVSLALGPEHLFVGSFEGSGNVRKDQRGSVTVLVPDGKVAKTLRGRSAGEYFGSDVGIGAALAVGAPGVPPLLVPR